MTSEDFKEWRQKMDWSQSKAAEELGVSKGSVQLYERGSRVDDGRPVLIPRTVALACAALFHRLEPWG